ncbi:uncharacterized protein EI90DRAFT_598657 [Cantharellus anzutake]|uniref:uncharacterized protein n=1 Tax=Cantharellus anzutake TaxID=1750568 RepID=UPI001905E9C4|nr:uncharacterized protein EI90DRAFT_598657 [Cantharellus anzutake]KAF8313306.1 hypothetical protein EI90DRAFT_598657 [Cantharellus anzutake]
MAFSDLKQLEEHLATRSYVEGYTPSQADVGVYKALKSAPPASEYPHASRCGCAALFGGAGASAPAKESAAEEEEIDLFGSDEEEDEEAERIRAERLAAYNEKKAHKPKVAAKSVVTLDVKPWDDETDMAELEKAVRSIQKEGLVWGSSKLVAVGYGIKKLQLTLVIEDELISLDELQEEIQGFDEYVQSTDIAAMQKL